MWYMCSVAGAHVVEWVWYLLNTTPTPPLHMCIHHQVHSKEFFSTEPVYGDGDALHLAGCVYAGYASN